MISVKISGRKCYNDLINNSAKALFDFLSLNGNVGIEVQFVSPKKIRELNSRMRAIDKPTDVLSFPFLQLEPFNYIKFSAKNYPLEIDSEGSVNLGGITICTQIAKKQAAEYGHCEHREVAYLFVHGLLHLFGFDHINKDDKAKMRQAEEQVMQLINLGREV